MTDTANTTVETPTVGDPEVLDIKVDPTKLTWGDYKFLRNFSSSGRPPEDFSDRIEGLLDRCIVGGSDNVPLADTLKVLTMIFDQAIGTNDPKGVVKKKHRTRR